MKKVHFLKAIGRQLLIGSVLMTPVMLLSSGLVYASSDEDAQSLQQLEHIKQLMQARNKLYAQAEDDRLKLLRQKPEDNAKEESAPAERAAEPQADEKSSDESMPKESANDAIDEAAFRQMLRAVLPLKPNHITHLKKEYTENKKAVESPIEPPRPVATTQFINLSPGATPPVIRLSKGFVSSLVFIDVTGAPWPIESYDIGDPSSFNIQWDKKSNTLMVQATKLYTYGNIAVKLWDLNTPIMMTLIPGQKAVDYRVDLRVPTSGPKARETVSSSEPKSASDELLNVLNGVPPANADEVIVSGGQAQAWVRGTTMFLRTESQLLSPGWVSSMSSADGMNAYELPVTPRLLVSLRGKIIQFKVEGF